MIPLEEVQAWCAGKSVVLVGNSGALLRSGLGTFIDQHEIVVRMNHGVPRREYASHLGSRTSIWVCSYLNKQVQQAGLPRFQPHLILRFNGVITDVHPKLHPRLFMGTKADYDQLCSEVGARPTTGCMTLHFFSSRIAFTTLNLVGYDFFKTGSWLHSVDPLPYFPKWGHDQQKEEAYMRGLVAADSRVSLLESAGAP